MATLAHLVLSLAAALALTGHPAIAGNRLAAHRDAAGCCTASCFRPARDA